MKLNKLKKNKIEICRTHKQLTDIKKTLREAFNNHLAPLTKKKAQSKKPRKQNPVQTIKAKSSYTRKGNPGNKTT